MECHRCPHRGELEGGKYRGMAFGETPCARCALVERSEHTRLFDEELEGAQRAQATGVNGQREVVYFDDDPEEEERLPMSVLQDAIAAVLSLRPHIRDVVCWRFAGMKYRDIAVLQGVSVAAVEVAHRRALRKWPALRAMFAEKLAKQRRRKPHGGKPWGSGRRMSRSCSGRRV